eukprot:1012487-Rhodomonas_salina.1
MRPRPRPPPPLAVGCASESPSARPALTFLMSAPDIAQGILHRAPAHVSPRLCMGSGMAIAQPMSAPHSVLREQSTTQ